MTKTTAKSQVDDLIIGIDPGMNYTGIVGLRGEKLVIVTLMERTPKSMPQQAYIDETLEYLTELQTRFPGLAPNFAVEAANAPNPYLGLINPNPILQTAKLAAAIHARFPEAISVEPGGNGSADPYSYPKLTQPRRKGGKGKDKYCHLRSAYDIALAGRKLRRYGLADLGHSA